MHIFHFSGRSKNSVWELPGRCLGGDPQWNCHRTRCKLKRCDARPSADGSPQPTGDDDGHVGKCYTHWIGFHGKILTGNPWVFTIKYRAFRLKFSHNPILCYTKLGPVFLIKRKSARAHIYIMTY